MPLAPPTITSIKALMLRAGIREQDLHEQFLLGNGAGGQKLNKTASAVRLTHISSKVAVKLQTTRSREDNRWLARRALAEKLLQIQQGELTQRQQEQAKIRRQKRRRSRRQRARMLDDKTKHSAKKALRRPIINLS